MTRRVIKPGLLLLVTTLSAYAHDVITTKVTFDREIVRLFNTHCISCHNEGGAAFSLATWKDARPWAKAIGEEVLQRRMPPWGAVKGFGDFRNDQGLTAEQLELIVDWEEGGAPEGEEKDLPVKTEAPKSPKLPLDENATHPAKGIVVGGEFKLHNSFQLDGLLPKVVADGLTLQVTAELPDGSVEPLLWMENYKKEYGHPFLLRRPLTLPAGTVIHGVPSGASVALLPGKHKDKTAAVTKGIGGN